MLGRVYLSGLNLQRTVLLFVTLQALYNKAFLYAIYWMPAVVEQRMERKLIFTPV